MGLSTMLCRGDRWCKCPDVAKDTPRMKHVATLRSLANGWEVRQMGHLKRTYRAISAPENTEVASDSSIRLMKLEMDGTRFRINLMTRG
ncbi:hypothetical protein TNIN_84631 [Trichonephila inaurata madagascariensis]|uniref:Uncharacterized protein n=1 Tax=Trichonephila inaurata madagascariensis TaxID=2747483 RepID=A0A8X7CEL5_9ARAC|nr:hypothetical protein TNIN_84631 [Trichonephila inaurata madagascariensis]